MAVDFGAVQIARSEVKEIPARTKGVTRTGASRDPERFLTEFVRNF
jgi:hypothetical protein